MEARQESSGERLDLFRVAHLRRLWALQHPDLTAAGLLGLASLSLYVRTAAPGVLTGDAGEWQYMPYVLGIPHPTGYPLYVLLGKAWTLLPWASVARQMNLLSAVLGAATVSLFYVAIRLALGRWLPALLVTGIFAVSPTFWGYNTMAALYSLNTFVLAGALVLLFAWEKYRADSLLWGMGMAWGLGLGNHLSMLLAAPFFILLVVLTERRLLLAPRRYVPAVVAFGLSLAGMYAYIPLRGPALLSGQEIAGRPLEVYTGLVSPYYVPTWQGFLDMVQSKPWIYEFTWDWGSIAGFEVYGRMIVGEFGPALILAPMGLLWLARQQARLGLALAIGYILAIFLVIRYRSPIHFPAYALPASLLLCLFMAAGMALVQDLLVQRWASHRVEPLLVGATLLLATVLAGRSLPLVDQSNAYSVERIWKEILDYPLEPGAGLMAHWGDLTPLWYYQHVAGYRRDLVGLFPPSERLAQAWLEKGHAVYLAGPLLGWGQSLPQHYRLVSWGYFAKVLLPDTSPRLPGEVPRRVLFGENMALVGQYLDPTPSVFDAVRLGLHWQVLASTSTDLFISLRLVDEKGQRVAQRDDLLVSKQYPWPTLPPGDDLFWVGHLPLPGRLPPGQYQVQAVVYHPLSGELALQGEGARSTVLNVGAIYLEGSIMPGTGRRD